MSDYPLCEHYDLVSRGAEPLSDWFKFEMCGYAYNLPLEVVKFWRGDFNSFFFLYIILLF